MGPLRPEPGTRTRRGQDRAAGRERHCGAAAPAGSGPRLPRQGSGCGSAPRPPGATVSSFRPFPSSQARKETPSVVCEDLFCSLGSKEVELWASGHHGTAETGSSVILVPGGSGAIESWCSPRVFMPCPCGQSWPAHPDATPTLLLRPQPLCPRLPWHSRLPSSTGAATLIPPSLCNDTDDPLSPAPGA